MHDWKAEARGRIEGLKLEPAREAEIVEELAQHLEDRYRELCSAGLPEQEAHRAALDEIGEGSRLVMELARVERNPAAEPVVLGAKMRGNMVSDAWRDLRYASRSLTRSRGFTGVAIICLALGIGGTTTIFSVIRPVLLKPLPYRDSDRLAMLMDKVKYGDFYTDRGTIGGPEFLAWKANSHTFEQIEAFFLYQASLTGGEQPVRVQVTQATPGLFSLLGTSPAMGRIFSSGEAGPPNDLADQAKGSAAGPFVAVISNRLWRTEFNSTPNVIGKTVKLDGNLLTIIGVMPSGFGFPQDTDIWMAADVVPVFSNTYLSVIGRLRARISRDQAQAELEAISDRVAKASGRPPGLGVNVAMLQNYLVDDVRPTLAVLFVAVLFVLLIACANVASLLLARGASRQKEIAIRASLGASRLRIVRQLLTESVLLSVVGAAAGVILAFGALKSFLALAPANIPRLDSARIDEPMLLFALSLSLVTGLLFGLAPAILGSRAEVSASIKEGTVHYGSASGRFGVRRILVASEIALALVLLAGSGLMLRSFILLQKTKLGFVPQNLLTMNVNLPAPVYKDAERMKSFYGQALDNLRSLPGVSSAAIVSALPLGRGGARISGDFTIEGHAGPPISMLAAKQAVSSGYFRAMGIPLIQGRAFTDQDSPGSPQVAMVSESFARVAWPNGDALGKRIDIGFNGEALRTIVGVVGDVRENDLNSQPDLTIYEPYLQVPREWQLSAMTFVTRCDSDFSGRVSELRRAVQAADPELPVFGVKRMEQVVSEKVTDPRFYTSLLGALACIAMILASAGIYGLVSYSVGRRTHEIGIRIALGARRSEVVVMFVKSASVLALFGVSAGLAGAYLLTRFIKAFLYQTTPTDGATFAAVSILLVAVVLTASYIPARRATRVDPVVALRYE